MKCSLMNNVFWTMALAAGVGLSGCSENGGDDAQPTPPTPVPTAPAGPSQVALWLTTANKTALFQQQPLTLNFTAPTANTTLPTITVDTTQTYQTIDGFGFTLTGGSAYVLHQMGATERAALLKELFATDASNIGTSYLRVSIGASDLDAQVFSYDDLPAGQTDPQLTKFSLDPDRQHLLPVLKEILAINPSIKILGSPWSPPTWMKTNGNTVNGSLKPEFYDTYAQYFVKYIQGMKAEGVTIDAITLQNEPLNPYNNPSMVMTATEQATFIKQNIGPALKSAGLTTKIILYDHNTDRTDYPLAVLADAQARQYVDGSAFHLYAGSINALSGVHNAYPDKSVYFTEQWVGAPGNFASDLSWHVNNLIIGATRNWSRNVLEWNLAADPSNGPHTAGGCTECLPAVTIGGNTVTRNPAYYIIAQAAKFVRPGSVRIDTSVPSNLPNVGFKNPSGQKVLIVLNTSSSVQTFVIKYRGKDLQVALEGGSVGTYVW